MISMQYGRLFATERLAAGRGPMASGLPFGVRIRLSSPVLPPRLSLTFQKNLNSQSGYHRKIREPLTASPTEAYAISFVNSDVNDLLGVHERKRNMPAARQGRLRTSSQGGGESSPEESESGQRTPSPSQHRKFLRSYASSSALPAVNGLEVAEDEGEIGPLTPNTRGRSSTNHNLNAGSSSRRFIARPIQPLAVQPPALPMFQSNRRFSRDELPARPLPHAASHSNLQRFSFGMNGSAIAESPYVSRVSNGAPFVSHHASSSASLPSHSPPPYDIACVNGFVPGSSVRRSSLADLPSGGLNGLERTQHEPSIFLDRDTHAEELYPSRVSRRRKGKGRSIDSLTDDAFSSSSSPPPATSSSIRTNRARLPQFSLDWRDRENGELLPGDRNRDGRRAFFGLIFCVCQLFVFDPKEFVDEFWKCTGRGVEDHQYLPRPSGYVPNDVNETAHDDLLPSLGICWPATHLTLSIAGGVRRPVIAWAIIGTTTAISRSVQIWVTSNIIWINDKAAAAAASEEEREERHDTTGVFFNRVASMIGGDDSTWADGSTSGASQAYRRRERRWNWKKVGLRGCETEWETSTKEAAHLDDEDED
ncbi:hypothetical protein BKA70DRAFT_1226118 [Coprinopsis sp. MPI-PUGE-AT-0042]|nr:hypothetical protein BKA70DRAFT_1226118 [Coprinopsis sp. MPI-PUGE-AT-0042]